MLVHLVPPLTPTDYVLVELTIPEKLEALIEERDPIGEIPSNTIDLTVPGHLSPPVSELEITRQAGGEWLVNESSAVLKVPSYVVKGGYNYLINPLLSEEIQVGDGIENPFDHRLFQNLENFILEMQELQERFIGLARDTEELLKRYRLF